MEQEIEQLRSLVEDLCMKVESLEERVSELEEGAKPTGPEPLLTCVQCLADYKESENAGGHCKYHAGTLKGGWKATYTCCNASAGDWVKAKSLPGCTKGRHQSKHHCEYMYANYYFHMQDLSNNAKELWLEMNIKDLVTDCCEWGEVGLSAEGKVFVLVGSNRIQPVAYAELTMKELKQCKKPVVVLFEKTDPVGWSMKAVLQAKGSVATAIVVSVKSASNKVPLVKKLSLISEGDSFKPGSLETESDPSPCHTAETGEMSPVPEVREGPQLEAGPDYSQNRKTDYPTETSDDMFALELEQDGKIDVNSGSRTRSGKWNNLFIAKVRLSNGVPGSVSIMKVFGEYIDKDGEWTKCDGIWIRPTEAEKFLETLDFTVDGTAPLVMVFQLAIGIDAEEPGSWAERERAHHSLPQPLHLRLTCVDIEGRTASLRLEQGNPPLNLSCCDVRQKNWAKGKPLLFYLFADDVDARKRSDVAIYYDDNGMLLFRPAPNDQGNTSMFLKQDLLNKASFQAKGSDGEVEVSSLGKENKGSSIKVFAIVKEDDSHAIKVVIRTPTSSASGVFTLPRDDFSTATISVSSQPVIVNSNFTVNWNVGRASKNDKIALFNKFGSSSVARGYNKKAELQGECQIKAPMSPGEYEVRYCPSWLTGSYTGKRHDTYIASATVSVTTA